MSEDRTSRIQQKIYEFIVRYMREEGMPPTNREVGTAMNLRSMSQVDYHLTMLEKKGFIEREAKKSRSIKLKKPLYGIPVLGSIAIGEPLEVFSEPFKVLEVGREYEQQGAYALVARGQSLIEDYICENDYVIIEPTFEIEDGDIVVAIHMKNDRFAILNRFYLGNENKDVFLFSTNSRANPTLIPKNQWNDEWAVQGKVLAIFRKSVVSKREISADVLAIEAGPAMGIKENGSSSQDEAKKDIDNLAGSVKSNFADNSDNSENETVGKNDLQEPLTWEKTLSDKLAQFKIDQNKAISDAAKDFTNQVIHDAVVYDRVVSAIDTAQDQLDQTVVQCREEAKQWFRYGLLAAILGFLVILGGVALAIAKLNVSLGF